MVSLEMKCRNLRTAGSGRLSGHMAVVVVVGRGRVEVV